MSHCGPTTSTPLKPSLITLSLSTLKTVLPSRPGLTNESPHSETLLGWAHGCGLPFFWLHSKTFRMIVLSFFIISFISMTLYHLSLIVLIQNIRTAPNLTEKRCHSEAINIMFLTYSFKDTVGIGKQTSNQPLWNTSRSPISLCFLSMHLLLLKSWPVPIFNKGHSIRLLIFLSTSSPPSWMMSDSTETTPDSQVSLSTYPHFSHSVWNLKWTMHATPSISLDALELPAAVSLFIHLDFCLMFTCSFNIPVSFRC